MPSPRNVSAFSSFTTIGSGVCLDNFLMAIHFARPHTGGTTQNNPLTTNGPKTQTPPGPVLGVSSGFVGFNAAMFLRAVREKVGLLDQG